MSDILFTNTEQRTALVQTFQIGQTSKLATRRVAVLLVPPPAKGVATFCLIMSIFGKAAEPKDVEVANVQPDGISALAWSPVADLLAVASWNNEVRLWTDSTSCILADTLCSQVRIYEVGPGGQNQGRAQYSHEGPVLCLTWSKVLHLGLFVCTTLTEVARSTGRYKGVERWSRQCWPDVRPRDRPNNSICRS